MLTSDPIRPHDPVTRMTGFSMNARSLSGGAAECQRFRYKVQNCESPIGVYLLCSSGVNLTMSDSPCFQSTVSGLGARITSGSPINDCWESLDKSPSAFV